jgi:hypothetical protein
MINDKWERIWKEAVVAYSRCYRILPERIEENHEKISVKKAGEPAGIPT